MPFPLSCFFLTSWYTCSQFTLRRDPEALMSCRTVGLSPESFSVSLLFDSLRFLTRLAMFRLGSRLNVLLLELMCLVRSRFKTGGRSSLDRLDVFDPEAGCASPLLEVSLSELCPASTACIVSSAAAEHVSFSFLLFSSSSLLEAVGSELSIVEVLTCNDWRNWLLSADCIEGFSGLTKSGRFGLVAFCLQLFSLFTPIWLCAWSLCCSSTMCSDVSILLLLEISKELLFSNTVCLAFQNVSGSCRSCLDWRGPTGWGPTPLGFGVDFDCAFAWLEGLLGLAPMLRPKIVRFFCATGLLAFWLEEPDAEFWHPSPWVLLLLLPLLLRSLGLIWGFVLCFPLSSTLCPLELSCPGLCSGRDCLLKALVSGALSCHWGLGTLGWLSGEFGWVSLWGADSKPFVTGYGDQRQAFSSFGLLPKVLELLLQLWSGSAVWPSPFWSPSSCRTTWSLPGFWNWLRARAKKVGAGGYIGGGPRRLRGRLLCWHCEILFRP